MGRTWSEVTTVQHLWQRLAALAEWQSLTALGAIVFITGLHYGTAIDRGPLHDLYRRLYYIPVIYGAVRYGAVGGVLLSVTVAFMYIPHLIALLAGHPDRWVDNVADLVLLLVVGILTGALVDALCRRERLAAIGSHASRLVHDVRSPMSAISAGARMMARPDLDDEAREEMADIVVAQVQRLADMSGEVLEYARGNDHLELRDCHLNELVEEVAGLQRNRLQEAGVHLDVSLGDDAVLRADPAGLHRVLTNLLENAKEAVSDGGRVQLTTAARGAKALIRVWDDGPGIPDEIADRIFEPFVTHGKHQGTGLGLAIAKEIVAAHGGELTAESRPGQGATFTISLPLRGGQAPATEAVPALPGQPGERGEASC